MQRRRTAGVTALEACLGIAFFGTLLAMAVPSFFRELETDRFAEAERELGRIADGISTYYGETHRVRDAPRTRCLPAGAGPTPVDFPTEPTLEGWPPAPLDPPSEEEGPDAEGPEEGATPTTQDVTGAAPVDEGWLAIGYAPTRPVRYRYAFRTVRPRCSVDAPPGEVLASVIAEADLDEDGVPSRLTLKLGLDETGELVILGPLRIDNRTE